MINELIEQIGGRERLEEMGKNILESRDAKPSEVKVMASALLAVMDAKPVGVTISPTLAAMDEVSQIGIDVYTTPPAARAPEGWKLVPLEPTQHMIDAHTEGMVCGGATRAYRAMLSAAPVPGEK